MNKKGLFGLFILLALSCTSSQYKYWDISKFNLKPGALKDNSEIKLLYTSQRPPSVSETECYIHLIVVSQETGDTFNILTAADNGLKREDSSTIFAYFDENNLLTKINQVNIDSDNRLDNIDSISHIKLNDIRKVARDPKYDYLANNNFPTVIGSIGLRTIPNN